ncbi:NAD(P)/FAD-dependent oxidoreductase [Sulfitobacter porphyrae]|uniref:NAD(P)/FAD-dependent oxidoreductase n=1 Tax=Sulfitobacter porphyrae TaxID=1246864 RepID=A0ABW2B1D3_9RHOB
MNRACRGFEARYPELGPVKVKAAWAGMIDTMPDIVPVIDRSPDIEGLVIGTGMSGHGFGIGPGVGRCLAALVTGGELGHDLSRFRASRFTDGSAIRLPPL